MGVTFRPSDERLVMSDMPDLHRVFSGMRVKPAIVATGVRLTALSLHLNHYNGVSEIQITGSLVNPGKAVYSYFSGS